MTLHKGKTIETILVPSEGQQTPLCSNEVDSCCPSLGSSDNAPKDQKDDVLLNYLASILVEAYQSIKYGK